jgi:hypothetical protein
MIVINDKDIINMISAKYAGVGLEIKEINFFGFRNMDDIDKNLWNDYIGYFTENEIGIMHGTTDPSTYYVKHPMNPDGLAVLCNGAHPDIWTKGPHGKSQYLTLVNTSTVPGCKTQKVWRLDKNLNFILNEDGTRKVFEGYFGCNFHHQNVNPEDTIGIWSAGCQVPYALHDWMETLKAFENTEMYKNDNHCTVSYALFDKTEMFSW